MTPEREGVPVSDQARIAEIERVALNRWRSDAQLLDGRRFDPAEHDEADEALDALLAALRESERQRDGLGCAQVIHAQAQLEAEQRAETAERQLAETREALREAWTWIENYPLSGKRDHEGGKAVSRRCCELLTPRLAAALAVVDGDET